MHDLNPPVTHVLAPATATANESAAAYSWGPFFPAAIFTGAASSYSNGVFTINWQGADPDQPARGTIASVTIYEIIDGSKPTAVATVSQPSFAAVSNQGSTYNVYSGSTTVQALGDGNPHTYAFYSLGTDDLNVAQVAGGVGAAFSPDVTFSDISFSTQLAVSQFTVENGIGERSYIRYLNVTFNQTLPSSTAVDLLYYGENLTPTSTYSSVLNLTPSMVSISGTGVALNFGAPGITSLLNAAPTSANTSTFGDGWYALGIDPYAGTAQQNTQTSWLPFFRLLGSVTGDQKVSAADGSAVSAARGQTGPLVSTDVNGDGVVNTADIAEVTSAKNAGDTVGAQAPAVFPAFQLFAGPAGPGGVAPLTQAQVEALLPTAIAAWQAAGLNAAGVQMMLHADIRVANLGGSILGLETPGLIEINQTAAGWKWFTGAGSVLAATDVDLRTVLEHELGHAVGLPDNALPGDLMDTTLGLGMQGAMTAVTDGGGNSRYLPRQFRRPLRRRMPGSR